MIRTALVVGAAGGIGVEIVKQLLGEGYQVTATVLNDKEAAHLQAWAPGVGTTLKLDLSNADGVLEELKRLAIPSLDAVVVCAAIGPTGPVEISPLAVLRLAFEINTVAAAAIYQACMPSLRDAKGKLVLISSFAGKVGLPFLGHYVASKHALEGLADVMRREAKADGVEVIVIEPGGVKTPMVTGQLESVARDRAALSPEEALRFGQFYDGFLSVAKKSWDTMLDPSVVANTVIEALKSSTPQIRYPVGDDAKFLCEVARKTDPEIDAIVASFMGA
ncbi:SDR family NAD(P)-dependent oxidoreductase [Ferribacterium limneticum]|uniref:SDR family NAD(P)-dependent oxidoreductase n=1 Tax=Ferribacterium limneticum TaxID=76259 RepID=UPI001CF817E3|nr:SDR family NAD(P)-dependent oxidoreductase [Ferribacterium limneticum]UCV23603.1 SDR family NAD(P)-dependent oxidoreductase [Ferribacterium limneticum]